MLSTDSNTRLIEQRDFLQSIVDTMRDAVMVLDSNLRVVSANRSFYHLFDTTPASTENALVYELGNGQWDIPALRLLLEDILPRDSAFENFVVEHDFQHIGYKSMLLNARKLFRPGNHSHLLLLSIEDVTEQRQIQARLQDAHESLLDAYQDLEAAHRDLQVAYEREHKIADALQRPLTLEVAEEAFPGIRVASLYQAAFEEAEIGGDFFDAFALPHGHIALAVADASGKGLQAAARTMQVKDVLRAFAREYPYSPGHIMARLNDYVCDTLNLDPDGSDAFVCLSLCFLEPKTGEATLLSAGAEPPFVLRANGDAQTLAISGVPLGITRQTLYSVATTRLEPGDTLVLLTDGITEARRRREFIDPETILELARQGREAPTLRGMAQTIMEGIKAFSGGSLRDDACLLLAQRR